MIHNKKYFGLILLLLTLAILIILPSIFGSDIAFSRPGGGSSYSGGRSGSGGGGGGDGIGLLIYFLFTVLPPQLSIPVIIAIFVVRFIIQKRRNNENEIISSAPAGYQRYEQNNDIEDKIDMLKKQDPNFSKVLFIDFANLIFIKYYSWFGKKDFKNISPYLLQNEQIKSKNIKIKQDIEEIVIGSTNISDINIYPKITGIAVDIDANFTVTIKGRSTRYAIVERWYFNRNKDVLSPEPDKLRKLACPNCGSTPNFTDAGDCAYCGNHIKNGEMQWYVKTHRVLSQKVFKTKGLAHYEKEQGTDLPTVFQPNLEEHIEAFAYSHGFNNNTWYNKLIDEVVSPYFFNIYEAWSNKNLQSVRNLLSDRLYESFLFWIDSYQREGLTNKLENIDISYVQLVNVDTDKFYDTLTFRVFASCLDYVEDERGKIKGGSVRKSRKFSEYWTFIRKEGVEKNSYDFSTCPNCGAPAEKIGQAGICEYCNSKISNGDYSWVLAIITQDEVYS